jgi:copper chaperone
MEKVTLKINGMSCGHCVKSVEGALKGLDGVTASEVVIGSANVNFDPSKATLDKIKEAIEEEGYEVVGANR